MSSETDESSSSDEHRHYDSQDTGPEWGTPAWVWEPLAESLGGFDLDPASGAEVTPIAETRYTIEDDGLTTAWFGDTWLNPPYGRTHNPRWAKRVTDQVENPAVDSITALVPASTSTNWWQNHYATSDYQTWIDTRVQFDGSGDNSASFASVICSWIEDPPEAYLDALTNLGTVTRRVD